jgi:hypothetical protein
MMTIAIDSGDMDAVGKRLRDAAQTVGAVVPPMPAGAAFGPAVLAGAVASFESAMRREAEALQNRWAGLETGVKAAYDDMSTFEAAMIADVGRMAEGLA